jgi:hypothetical protein
MRWKKSQTGEAAFSSPPLPMICGYGNLDKYIARALQLATEL